jgi:hypothetical protein
MADLYLLENGTDHFLLEDGSGVLVLDSITALPGAIGVAGVIPAPTVAVQHIPGPIIVMAPRVAP